jgi:type IV secretory pathway TrbD component
MPRASARPAADQRFVFLDLDSLLQAVQTHVLAHEAQFHTELARFSSDVALAPERLTVLLDDQHPNRVQCWRGTYCNPNAAEARALEAVRSDGGTRVDWKLTQKGTAQHPTLEKMLKRHLSKTGALNGGKRTLVLATGVLSNSLKSCVDAYLKAQWHVQLVTLDSSYSQSGWQFTELEGFHVKSVDKYLQKLLTQRQLKPAFERKASSPTMRPEPSLASSSSCGSPVKSFEMPLEYYQAAQEDRRAGMFEQEVGDIERRKARLATLSTGKYAQGGRNRHVFMNLDNIAGAVCNSQWLYQRIEGARSGYDVRLNFRALTERVCGTKAGLVKRRLAAYRKMPRELALPLQELDWEISALSQSSSGNRGLYYVLLDLLETAGSAKHKNTLVLVMGDGALGGSGAEQKEATKDLLTKFLEKNWFVEIHSWLHALNDWFLDMQEQHQYRVAVKPLDDDIHDLVYLKEDEEEVWVEPVWHDPSGRQREAADALRASSPVPRSPPAPSAWGATTIPTLSLFPTTPFLTLEQKVEQRLRLENERRDLLERLRKNQDALDALELDSWSMQILQQQELARVAQQASDKQLAIRMAEEEEMQLKLLREYEETQEEEPWNWA